ncbi:MAG: hypothetical protein IPK34_07085 [Ramlibacter sp.]|nr:hypothetical protein [Ramlibacter sp.]
MDGTTINLGGDVTTTAGGKVVFTSPITLGAGGRAPLIPVPRRARM